MKTRITITIDINGNGPSFVSNEIEAALKELTADAIYDYSVAHMQAVTDDRGLTFGILDADIDGGVNMTLNIKEID